MPAPTIYLSGWLGHGFDSHSQPFLLIYPGLIKAYDFVSSLFIYDTEALIAKGLLAELLRLGIKLLARGNDARFSVDVSLCASKKKKKLTLIEPS